MGSDVGLLHQCDYFGFLVFIYCVHGICWMRSFWRVQEIIQYTQLGAFDGHLIQRNMH